MRSESDIVGSNSRLGRNGIARRILGADEWGGIEKSVREEVGEEAEDVDGGEVDGCAGCGAPTEVEERLRVEGEGPGEGARRAVRESGGLEGLERVLDPAQKAVRMSMLFCG